MFKNKFIDLKLGYISWQNSSYDIKLLFVVYSQYKQSICNKKNHRFVKGKTF